MGETQEESDATKRDKVETKWRCQPTDEDNEIGCVKRPHPPVMIGGVAEDEGADDAPGEEERLREGSFPRVFANPVHLKGGPIDAVWALNRALLSVYVCCGGFVVLGEIVLPALVAVLFVP